MAVVRDADGNALGGIRTPAIDAPVSTLTGEGNPSSIFCILFGQEVPFTAEQLGALYADDAAYVAAVTAAADGGPRRVRPRVRPRPDRRDAEASGIPG